MDLRDALEPIGLLKASQICREMKAGETQKIWVEDTDFHRNLLKLLPSFHVRVIADEKGSDPNTGWQVIIQKK
jgi:TusA-related sulfurtransferase